MTRTENYKKCDCGHNIWTIDVHEVTIIDGLHSHAPYAHATICADCFEKLKTICGLTDKDFEDEE